MIDPYSGNYYDDAESETTSYEEDLLTCSTNTISIFNPQESKEELDNVNHPSHYTQGSVECIDAMISAYGINAVMNFCQCNAFKYLWRFNNKNKIEDLDKAQWYINKYKDLYKSEK